MWKEAEIGNLRLWFPQEDEGYKLPFAYQGLLKPSPVWYAPAVFGLKVQSKPASLARMIGVEVQFSWRVTG